MSKNDESISFGLGLLAGVVGGIVAGVLLAPTSGEELRTGLTTKAKKIKNNFPQKIEHAKRKSICSIEKTKASIESVIEDIQDTIKAKKMANAKKMESESLKNI